MGLPDKALPKTGLYVYDRDLKRWVKLSFDITSTGEILTTSYNRPNLYVGTVTIASAGTGQQGPTVPVPAGFYAAWKGRDGNTGNVYFGTTQTGVQTSATRATLSPGAGARARITNFNLLWFDAATTGDIIELFVEL